MLSLVLKKINKQGQIVLEILWMFVFVFGFIAVISHVSDVGNKEISSSRIGK